MVGVPLRAIRIAILFLLASTSAFADAPVTSYECAPGTPVKGIGCSCPKASHIAKRDPLDEGKAICVEKPKTSTPPGGYGNPKGPTYDTLLAQANDFADAYNCTKAEDVYQQALKLKANGVEALVGSGNCMARQSKWTNAHLRFDKALTVNPRYEPALWGKAEAYRLAYKKDDAIAAYKQYLDAFPNAYKAKQALEKLQGGTVSTPPPPPPPPPDDTSKPIPGAGGRYKTTGEMKIVVTGASVSLNGISISGKPLITDIERVYGKADRLWDTGSSNRVFTWDSLGLVVYESRDASNAPTGRCISTTFPYKPMGSSYDPKVMFGGSITVDGRTMTPSLDIATIKSRPGAGQPYGANSIVFDKGDIHVFTIAKSTGPIDLVEISYWQQNKGDPLPGASGSGGGGNGKIASAADVRVEIAAGGKVSLQGTEISGKPMLADIEKILGKPSRVWDKKGGANRIHTWDDLGLIVYEPYNGHAISLTMPYKAMSNDFSPKTLFKGRVSLDGRGFYNFNTIGTIKSRTGATQPYGPTSVVFDFGDIHVFTTAPKETQETIDLVEISFWQKK